MFGMKKVLTTAALVLTAIILVSCGKPSAAQISKLEFGMTKEQVGEIISYETTVGSYIGIPSDIDERLNSFRFNFSDNSELFAVYLESDYGKLSDAEKLHKELMKKLADMYGFSEDDWSEQEENKYLYEYDAEGCTVELYLCLWDEGDESFASLTIASFEHDEPGEHKNIPVVPQ